MGVHNVSMSQIQPGFTFDGGVHANSMQGQITTDIYHWFLHPNNNKQNDLIENQTPFLLENSYYGSGNDPQYWQLPEIVTIDGKDYYHIVVGSEADGFLQETYIQTGYTINFDSTVTQKPVGNLVYAWPEIWAANSTGDKWGSASEGDHTVKIGENWSGGGGEATTVGNAADPLGLSSVSGNGTGNPNKVIIRQLMKDDEITQVFLKERLANKPKITQDIDVANSIRMTFEVDMSNSTYSQDNLDPLSITNTIELLGDNVPTNQGFGDTPDSTDFDVIARAQASDVNAGKYTYTPPAIGDDPELKGTNGVYTYVGNDGFEFASTDWATFYDTNEATGNPWSYNTNKP